MQRGGKLGLVRYVGVLVGYADNSPSYRVWNPLKAKKVANVGGAEFDESVGKAWWTGGLGGGNLADIEVVTFLDAEGDGDIPADWVGGGGTPAVSGGGQPPGGGGPPDASQPMDGVRNLEEVDEEGIDPDMPELLEDDDDEDDEE